MAIATFQPQDPGKIPQQQYAQPNTTAYLDLYRDLMSQLNRMAEQQAAKTQREKELAFNAEQAALDREITSREVDSRIEMREEQMRDMLANREIRQAVEQRANQIFERDRKFWPAEDENRLKELAFNKALVEAKQVGLDDFNADRDWRLQYNQKVKALLSGQLETAAAENANRTLLAGLAGQSIADQIETGARSRALREHGLQQYRDENLMRGQGSLAEELASNREGLFWDQMTPEQREAMIEGISEPLEGMVPGFQGPDGERYRFRPRENTYGEFGNNMDVSFVDPDSWMPEWMQKTLQGNPFSDRVIRKGDVESVRELARDPEIQAAIADPGLLANPSSRVGNAYRRWMGGGDIAAEPDFDPSFGARVSDFFSGWTPWGTKIEAPRTYNLNTMPWEFRNQSTMPVAGETQPRTQAGPQTQGQVMQSAENARMLNAAAQGRWQNPALLYFPPQ